MGNQEREGRAEGGHGNEEKGEKRCWGTGGYVLHLGAS